MNGYNQHVVPRELGWAVKHEGGKRASKRFLNKWSAEDYARKLAAKKSACAVLHKRDNHFASFVCEAPMNEPMGSASRKSLLEMVSNSAGKFFEAMDKECVKCASYSGSNRADCVPVQCPSG